MGNERLDPTHIIIPINFLFIPYLQEASLTQQHGYVSKTAAICPEKLPYSYALKKWDQKM